MNKNVFDLIMIIVMIQFAFGGKNCQENGEPKCAPNIKMKEESNQDSEFKKISKNALSNQQNSKLIATERSPIPKTDENERREGNAETPDIHDERTIADPGYGNPDMERQNLFVSDDAGRYNVHLESVRSSKPPNLNAALGAISAHILNPRTDDEYIPYPPNGDPYNYLAYRGHPQTTEPPVVRAYETATNFNYGGGHPPANFAHRVSNGGFPNDAYRQGFHSQFENFETSFYANPNIFEQGGFYASQQRDLEPIFHERLLFDGGSRALRRFA